MKKSIENKFKKLGERIKYLREQKDITLKEFSEKSGIREQYLKRIESGKAYKLSLSHLEKISNILKLKIKELLYNL